MPMHGYNFDPLSFFPLWAKFVLDAFRGTFGTAEVFLRNMVVLCVKKHILKFSGALEKRLIWKLGGFIESELGRDNQMRKRNPTHSVILLSVLSMCAQKEQSGVPACMD